MAVRDLRGATLLAALFREGCVLPDLGGLAVRDLPRLRSSSARLTLPTLRDLFSTLASFALLKIGREVMGPLEASCRHASWMILNFPTSNISSD